MAFLGGGVTVPAGLTPEQRSAWMQAYDAFMAAARTSTASSLSMQAQAAVVANRVVAQAQAATAQDATVAYPQGYPVAIATPAPQPIVVPTPIAQAIASKPTQYALPSAAMEEIQEGYPDSDIIPIGEDTPAGAVFESGQQMALRTELPTEQQAPYAPVPVTPAFKFPVLPLIVGAGALFALWLVFRKKRDLTNQG